MKREREKHITRLHIIIFCLVVIAGLITFFTIKSNINKELVSYKNFEKELVNATKNYYKINKTPIKEGFEVKIKMETLVQQNFLSNDLTNECKGYTIIGNNKTLDGDYELDYTAYIKCGDKYVSDNYSESSY